MWRGEATAAIRSFLPRFVRRTEESYDYATATITVKLWGDLTQQDAEEALAQATWWLPVGIHVKVEVGAL